MYSYWKTRYWSVLINIEANDPNDPARGASQFTFGYDISDESQLVCNPEFKLIRQDFGYQGWDEADFDFINPYGLKTELPPYRPFVEGLFYPYADSSSDKIYIGHTLSINGYEPTGYINVDIGIDTNSTISPFTVSIPYAKQSELFPDDNYFLIIVDFDISIGEEWPYAD